MNIETGGAPPARLARRTHKLEGQPDCAFCHRDGAAPGAARRPAHRRTKPASVRGHTRSRVMLFQTFHLGSLASSVKIISIIGRRQSCLVVRMISLRVKTSTSVLSYVSTNGRGKRVCLFQLLDGTTVSPPKSHFCFRVFLSSRIFFRIPPCVPVLSMTATITDHLPLRLPPPTFCFQLPRLPFCHRAFVRSLPSRSYAPFPQGSFPDDDLLHPLMSAFASVLVSSSIRNFRLIASQRRRLTFPLALLQMIHFLSSDFRPLKELRRLALL